MSFLSGALQVEPSLFGHSKGATFLQLVFGPKCTMWASWDEAYSGVLGYYLSEGKGPWVGVNIIEGFT